jgi:hypothetical protein
MFSIEREFDAAFSTLVKLRTDVLVVLCHKMRRAFFLNLLAQHGHLGSLLAIATIK